MPEYHGKYSKHTHWYLQEHSKVNAICVLLFVPSQAYEKMEFILKLLRKAPLLDLL